MTLVPLVNFGAWHVSHLSLLMIQGQPMTQFESTSLLPFSNVMVPHPTQPRVTATPTCSFLVLLLFQATAMASATTGRSLVTPRSNDIKEWDEDTGLGWLKKSGDLFKLNDAERNAIIEGGIDGDG